MCNGELGNLTYNWVRGETMPKPNFKTVHTCQNWDRLTEWAGQHSVDSLLLRIVKPKSGPELGLVPCQEGLDCGGVR